MPATDYEVFELLISDTESEPQILFLAYATFANHKREWIKHYKQQHDNAAPSQSDIDQWISNITHLQFNDMKEEAARLFDSAARDYLSDEIEVGKKQAVDASVLAEVKSFTSPWRHLGIALLMAILAPILLGG